MRQGSCMHGWNDHADDFAIHFQRAVRNGSHQTGFASAVNQTESTLGEHVRPI